MDNSRPISDPPPTPQITKFCFALQNRALFHGEKRAKKCENMRGRGVHSKGGKREKRTRENRSEPSWPPFTFLRSQANGSLISSSFTGFFRNKKARFVNSHIHLAITGESFTHSLLSHEYILSILANSGH